MNQNMQMIIDPRDHFLRNKVTVEYIIEALGFIPFWLKQEMTLPAIEAIKKRYQMGWFPFDGFKFDDGRLEYPGDPTLYPLIQYIRPQFPNELVYQYQHAWVCVYDKSTDTFSVARID